MSDEDKHVLVGYPTGVDAYISKTVVEVVGLRDQFAMAALKGLLSNNVADHVAVRKANEIADLMMEKRK